MLAAAAALVLGLGVGSPEVPEEVARALESLRERRFHTNTCYFHSTHAWPSSSLLVLMEARFAATPALLAELEWLDRESWAGNETQPDYRNVLYYVLGMVKDPAAIPWLLTRMTGTGRAEMYDTWLPEWQRSFFGPSYAERAWLENEASWSGVMRALATQADTPERRLNALEVLQQWFYDAATVRLFEAARADVDATAEQRLTTEFFFDRNGLPVDDARVAAVIDELRRTEAGRRRLWLYGRRMRHAAFAPWLMERFESGQRDEFIPWIALQEITHQPDARSPREARAWWERHRSQGRQAWVATYFARLFHLHERAQRTDGVVPRLAVREMTGDLLVADHLPELSTVPDYQVDVCRLVRFIYRPHLRDQLGDVLFALSKDEAADPEARAAAREVLMEYDYLPGAERDWMAALPYARGP